LEIVEEVVASVAIIPCTNKIVKVIKRKETNAVNILKAFWFMLKRNSLKKYK